jgi:hypothetical protein
MVEPSIHASQSGGVRWDVPAKRQLRATVPVISRPIRSVHLRMKRGTRIELEDYRVTTLWVGPEPRLVTPGGALS